MYLNILHFTCLNKNEIVAWMKGWLFSRTYEYTAATIRVQYLLTYVSYM